MTSTKRITASETAQYLRKIGISPIRLNGKSPVDQNWQESAIPDDKLDEYFDGYGIGVLTGKRSGNLADVDIDHPTAVKIAKHFLLKTGMSHGRKSKPESHRFYHYE